MTDEQDAQPRVAGVVLAYHPDATIVHNVKALLDQVDAVYIVNNSPGESATQVLAPLASRPEVEVVDLGGNLGVGAGFNAGMRRALAADFDHVWIFDQDSTVAPGMLRALLAHARDHGARTGILGPALRSAETGLVYAAESGVGAAPRDTLIASGSLFSRALLEEVGLHDEWMFIDYVDHDICLRARSRGFVHLKVFDTLLDHRFGESEPSRLLGRRVYLANYSPMRLYYQTRNRVVLMRRFGPRGWAWEDFVFTSKAWIKILFLERDRWGKLRAAVRGAMDGFRASREPKQTRTA